MAESRIGRAVPAHSAQLTARRYAALLVIAAAVVLVDQIVKQIVTHAFGTGNALDVLGGLIRLDYTRNTGAAFGLFRAGGGLFAGIALVVSGAIVLYYRRVASGPLLIRAALGLVLGGALGNLLDRIRLGYVVDFIDLRWWPVFNLADSAIVVGVFLLVVQSLLRTDSR